MGKEIERKFLVTDPGYREGSLGILHRQGYLSTAKERTVRVRTVEDKGFLTIKGLTRGISRAEFEYEIPLHDAEEMLGFCEGSIVEKMRYRVMHDDLIWEVDEFLGENRGLIVAEVELESEDQEIRRQSWVGEEVSADPRYINSNLARNPYKSWKT